MEIRTDTSQWTWYVHCNGFFKIKNHRRPSMNRRPIHGIHGRGMGVHAHFTPLWRLCHPTKVDTSPAIHRCRAYGIVKGRLLHAYAMPMIFNWGVNASSCILFFLHIHEWDLTENYYKRLYYHTDLNNY